ncbi:PQQ-binding-like beta-propeller repeat protein [Streptomyces sp. cmx-4-9]|uniref:outer membrane protein assembly factor BamB family protein n=1 Tax=Streptomyces sp. cmx-4-9 TaxID=2790941 RepID=UPI0039813E21
MSTPPPPHQPPPGGYGAPPPAGGFGAPVPPPPQQAPATPPPPQQPPATPPPPQQAPATPPPPHQPPGAPTQPAYGYPQTQPGYGYPQQPGAPGPFGAPTTPLQATGSPGGAGGNDKRTQLMIVGAALLAMVLIVGGGFWYVSGDSGGGGTQPTADGGPSGSSDGDKPKAGAGGTEKVPANPKSKTLVNVPLPTPEEQVTVKGSWLTDTTYVKGDVAKVVGYNLVDGGKKWEIPLPAQLCGATKHISENKTAILFEEGMPSAEKKYQPCTQVGVIDLEAGKLLWSSPAKSATGGDKNVTFSEVTVSGQTVAAGGLSGGGAWNLADGKNLWQPKVDNEGCYDLGYAGGEALAVLRKCGRSPNQTLYAQSLDPASGAPKSSYKLSPGIEWAGIISTKPLIVAADVGKTAKNATGVSDLFVLDDGGQLKSRISLASGNFNPQCPATEVEQCMNMVVGNGKVYVPSYEHQGQDTSGARTNELLSFDLETGKQTNEAAPAGERYKVMPLRMDGSNVIAYKIPPYDKGGQIVSIDGNTMKETLLMENPGDKTSQRAETRVTPTGAEYRYHNGKFFIARWYARKPYGSAGEPDPEYLFVSYTAS